VTEANTISHDDVAQPTDFCLAIDFSSTVKAKDSLLPIKKFSPF